MREVPFETMYVEWTVRRMVDHFERSGFSVYTDTVQEIAEALVPLDRILGVAGKNGVRVFAFQFKAPEVRRGSLVWRVASSSWHAQLDLLREARHRGWIWYALPFFTQHSDHMHALHLCHFVPPATLCDKARFIAWNGEVLFHFPCTAPRDLAGSELPFAVGSHSGNVELFERTIEVRPRARQVCADPLLNVKESWGTLLQRMERSQFGLVVRRPEDLLATPDDPPDHPLDGPGCALAIDTIRRVVSVISLMVPPKQIDTNSDGEMLEWLGSDESTDHRE
jgi:hypothetical protein